MDGFNKGGNFRVVNVTASFRLGTEKIFSCGRVVSFGSGSAEVFFGLLKCYLLCTEIYHARKGLPNDGRNVFPFQ